MTLPWHYNARSQGKSQMKPDFRLKIRTQTRPRTTVIQPPGGTGVHSRHITYLSGTKFKNGPPVRFGAG
ncbi:hypothetical protein B0H19DRAFT_1089103 [Mycena capillaripes]|nr:hypothetical protein B0H19DRAFT_1089103 [Mycena capillaripes]